MGRRLSDRCGEEVVRYVWGGGCQVGVGRRLSGRCGGRLSGRCGEVVVR